VLVVVGAPNRPHHVEGCKQNQSVAEALGGGRKKYQYRAGNNNSPWCSNSSAGPLGQRHTNNHPHHHSHGQSFNAGGTRNTAHRCALRLPVYRSSIDFRRRHHPLSSCEHRDANAPFTGESARRSVNAAVVVAVFVLVVAVNVVVVVVVFVVVVVVVVVVIIIIAVLKCRKTLLLLLFLTLHWESWYSFLYSCLSSSLSKSLSCVPWESLLLLSSSLSFSFLSCKSLSRELWDSFLLLSSSLSKSF
jgi:hypothetical protein